MRSMWKGSISFGLVNIPVKMYAATEEKSVRFNQLHTLCHTPIKYEKVCPHCRRPVASKEIVRGYEYESGQYVLVTDEEWESFSQRSTKTVDILRFVELAEIDPIFFNKTYYLEPSETGGKAYLLLKEAMSGAGKIAVAKITIRSKPSLAVMRVFREILALETIFYPDEIRDEKSLERETGAELQPRELDMALSLITSLTEPFRPEEYSDERRTALLEFLENKIQGQDVAVTRPSQRELPAVDLMTALEASLQARKAELEDFSGEVRH